MRVTVNYDAIEKSPGEWYQLGGADHRVVSNPAVREWRMEHLIAAGYPVWQAEELAKNADVELWWACDLAKQCQDVDVAWRIIGVSDKQPPGVELERIVAV